MAERSTILKKRVDELESRLAGAFDLQQPEAVRSHQIVDDDIEQCFVFLKSLLSAEIASQPHNGGELESIGAKLCELEAAFRGGGECGSPALVGPNLDDSLSVCSDCVHAFLDDGNVDTTAGDLPAPTEEKQRVGRVWGKYGKLCGAFGSGIITGVVCIIMLLSYSTDYVEYEAGLLLRPT